MKVRDIMQTPPPTVDSAATVTEVATRILKQSLPGVVVIGADGEIAGIVTQRDLVSKHATVHLPFYFGLLGFTIPFEKHRTETDLQHAFAVCARDLMEQEFITIDPDMDVDDAAQLMVDEGANPVAVIEDGKLVGVVTDADIIRLLIVEESDSDQQTP